MHESRLVLYSLISQQNLALTRFRWVCCFLHFHSGMQDEALMTHDVTNAEASERWRMLRNKQMRLSMQCPALHQSLGLVVSWDGMVVQVVAVELLHWHGKLGGTLEKLGEATNTDLKIGGLWWSLRKHGRRLTHLEIIVDLLTCHCHLLYSIWMLLPKTERKFTFVATMHLIQERNVWNMESQTCFRNAFRKSYP